MRVQLSVTLQGIVTQQLLPTADGSGRVVCAEVLALTPAVRNLIREGKTHQIHSVLQTSGANGMQSMDSRSGHPRARRQGHARAGRGAVEHSRRAAPAHGGLPGGLTPLVPKSCVRRR